MNRPESTKKYKRHTIGGAVQYTKSDLRARALDLSDDVLLGNINSLYTKIDEQIHLLGLNNEEKKRKIIY